MNASVGVLFTQNTLGSEGSFSIMVAAASFGTEAIGQIYHKGSHESGARKCGLVRPLVKCWCERSSLAAPTVTSDRQPRFGASQIEIGSAGRPRPEKGRPEIIWLVSGAAAAGSTLGQKNPG